MDFFWKLFPKYAKQNMANADIEENDHITREPSIECYSEIDKNENILGIEGNVPVNTNEYGITKIDSSVVKIEEFGVTKTFLTLENVTPIEITTNDDDNYQEPMENGIKLIEDARFLNNATEIGLLLNSTEVETVLNKSIHEEIQTLLDSEVLSVVNKTEADSTCSNALDDKTMQGLEEFQAVLQNIDKHGLTNEFGTELTNINELDNIIYEMDAANEDLDSVSTSFQNVNENVREINSNLEDKIDIISISSTEDEHSEVLEIKNTDPLAIQAVSEDIDSDDGYKSSDFEFISETEAIMAGIIINHGLENIETASHTSSEPTIFCFDEEFYLKNEEDLGEGTSRQNRTRNEFEDRSYRNDHHIPIGDDYLGLFQGIYNPLLPMSDIHFLEHKSVRASAMNMQYDGIGFDKQLAMRRYQPDSSEDEFEEESKESVKKILNMYPGENRKRRRRYF